MGQKVEMIGKRFGRLVVLAEDKRNRNGVIFYKCFCDCGKEKVINGVSLRSGATKSCGCYNREIISKPNADYKTKLYYIHRGIKRRCSSPGEKAYRNYGGRGIKLCDEWLSFANFKEWAYSNGYKEGLWIERIDNEKGYSPDNCRWATPKEQGNNKRTNVLITIVGVTKTASEWADYSGIKVATIYRRLELGWQGKDIIKPIDKSRSHGEAIRKWWHDGSRVYVDKDNPRTEITIEDAF